MRTKALLCAAALAAGAVTSMAQSNVYSLNVVGYVNTLLVGGGALGKFQMIANPLNTTNNNIGTLIPSAPDGTVLYKFNGTSFDIATSLGGWDHPEYTLNPGEGAIVNSPNNWTNTFVGEVLQGTGLTPNAYPAGFSIRASKFPLAGTLTQLQLPASQFKDGDVIYQFNTANQSYDIYTLLGGSWIGGPLSEPTLAVGEALWLQPQTAGSWNQTFTVQ
jgi:hypothetical protein